MIQCFYCNQPAVGTDHVYPRRKISRFQRFLTAEWNVANKVPACFHCNGRKGDQSPHEWLKSLPEPFASRLACRLALLGRPDAEIAAAAHAVFAA
ncbi:MAG: endonuclease [Devosia sp.]|jgi:hypothetical protein|nr:endonuclease [Devosia sp.]